jgi:peptidoglycan-associated lipoprotein
LTRYFIALGIDPKRLKTISYGKERPVCTEATEACWSQNRRTVSTIDQ